MQNLSPLALIVIGLVIVIIMIMNIGLVTLVRYKPQLKMKPPAGQDGLKMNRLVDVMKDPFGEERKQLDELSRLVSRLHEEGSTKNEKKP
jgi:hypothetical protein